MSAVSGKGITEIAFDKIKTFHDRPFRMYEGEWMEEMVEGIKEHGVLNLVIVLKRDEDYEMLSSHNRWNATKLASSKKKRSFSYLAILEKAAVLKARYEKVSNQGKCEDILREIVKIEGKEALNTSCSHGGHKLNIRNMVGKVYELSGSSVVMLLRTGSERSLQVLEMKDLESLDSKNFYNL